MFGMKNGAQQKRFCRWWFVSLSTAVFNPCSTSAWESSLLGRAALVREKIVDYPSYDDLSFSSAYPKSDGTGMRGFCNWILPRRIMVGQYPGQSPETVGPSSQDVQSHLESLVNDAGITLFCSLQSEIPPQTDFDAWSDGEIYLSDPRDRRQFPRPFTHYAPIIQSLSPDTCQFLHAPIEDLSVPNSKSLQELLLHLLTAIDEEDRILYIHCWGGRGRAGLVGSCLLSLLFPEVEASAILDLVQAGYDTRAGAEAMPWQLSKSPQTDSQRAFVRAFVKERQRQHAK